MHCAWDAWCRTAAYLEQHLAFAFGLNFTIVLVLVLLTITTRWPDAFIWAAGAAAGATLGSWFGRRLRPPAGTPGDPRGSNGPATR